MLYVTKAKHSTRQLQIFAISKRPRPLKLAGLSAIEPARAAEKTTDFDMLNGDGEI